MQFRLGLLASACALFGMAASGAMAASSAPVQIDADDIGGVVSGAKGPEAGVWVIAETQDLETQFAKIVVTDDQGRFVLPDLPKAKYKVWVRGYGLTDSAPTQGVPGQSISFTVKPAGSAKEAAELYPANYWLALIKPPEENEFPGTGPKGNGINPGMGTQQEWMGHFKEQCHFCHQLGNKTTREVAMSDHVEAWDQRIQKARDTSDVTVGVHGKAFAGAMVNNMTRFGKQRGLAMFADWTKRVEKGDIPPAAPPRPMGLERNVVLSLWDFAGGHFIHDETTSDKRNPLVNANGPVYGLDTLAGNLAILEPTTFKTKEVVVPGLYRPDLKDVLSLHNPMMDQKGRVWMTMLGGEKQGQDYCGDGSTAYSKYYPNPTKTTPRISVYDPVTKKIEVIPTCFGIHHINFGHDKNNTLYFSGDTNVLGWIDTKVYDETKDPKKALGWCPWVVDTNGDGKISSDRKDWNEPDGQIIKISDAQKDSRVSSFAYGMNISPVDDAIWSVKFNPAVPSGILRLERGSNPPETCKAEYYEPPRINQTTYAAFNARGVDIDSHNVAWVAFGSGQMASFDRSKCKITSGPKADGQQCPEGWTFYDSPGPKIAGQVIGSADWHYLTWVDYHDVLGLGKDVPIVPGSNSDSLLAFKDGKWVVLRVPYPMGFYTRGLDGRIDDPKAGWKGKGLWADYGEVPLWHQEEGEGSKSKMVKFQLRPDPLAH